MFAVRASTRWLPHRCHGVRGAWLHARDRGAPAQQQDRVLERLQRHGTLGECGPRLNEARDTEYWFSQPGAPKRALDNEKPQGETVDYDTLLSSWTAQDTETAQ